MVSRLQRPVGSRPLREMGLPEDKVTDACERIAAHYVEWQESSFPGILGNVVGWPHRQPAGLGRHQLA